MFKNIKSIFKLFVLALITVGVGIVVIKLQYNNIIEIPNSESSDKITITINQGESVDAIIDTLVDNDLLKESWARYFKFYLKEKNLGQNLQAGTYNIPMNLNIKELVQTLQQAQAQDIWVTIPEGLRKDEIARIIDEEFSSYETTSFSQQEFLNLTVDKEYISTLGFPFELTNLEGYIFPDKYAFAMDSTTDSVLKVIIENFKNKVGVDDSYTDIIIASMVEREGYTSEDRPMIADIINRRLKEGWLLQIDATLLYPVKDWNHEITKADKDSDSPYNTYRSLGLPPTPICNPGLQSINAARNPQSNEYYFYIHDNDGNAHFAKTLAEHNANVAKYLR